MTRLCYKYGKDNINAYNWFDNNNCMCRCPNVIILLNYPDKKFFYLKFYGWITASLMHFSICKEMYWSRYLEGNMWQMFLYQYAQIHYHSSSWPLQHSSYPLRCRLDRLGLCWVRSCGVPSAACRSSWALIRLYFRRKRTRTKRAGFVCSRISTIEIPLPGLLIHHWAATLSDCHDIIMAIMIEQNVYLYLQVYILLGSGYDLDLWIKISMFFGGSIFIQILCGRKLKLF